ncbi:MAG: hypothetical protein U0132_21670 [Gemmatimonadaceae bacterium]
MLSGYFATTILIVVLTVLAARLLIPLELLKQNPPGYTQQYLIANFIYSFLAAALGGWITARLAPQHPLAHAGALTAVMLIVAASEMASRARGNVTPSQPSWYGWSIVCVGAVGALAGGWLLSRQLRRPSDGLGGTPSA